MLDKIKKGAQASLDAGKKAAEVSIDAGMKAKDQSIKYGKKFIRKKALESIKEKLEFAQKKETDFTKEEMIASHVFVDERLVAQETWEVWMKSLEERTVDEIAEDAIPTKLPDSQVPPGFPLLMLLAMRFTDDSHGETVMNQTST